MQEVASMHYHTHKLLDHPKFGDPLGLVRILVLRMAQLFLDVGVKLLQNFVFIEFEEFWVVDRGVFQEPAL